MDSRTMCSYSTPPARASLSAYRVISGTGWCNAVTDTPARAVVSYIEARRIDRTHDGRAVHAAVCPFCRAEAVEVAGETNGCRHLKDLDHRITGSYFMFERPL